MPATRHSRTERHEAHPLVEGLRGVLVLVLTTAGVAALGWLVAVAFAAVFR